MAIATYVTNMAGAKLDRNDVSGTVPAKLGHVRGQTAQGDGGSEFIYAVLAATANYGDLVVLDTNNTASPATTTNALLSARMGTVRATSGVTGDGVWVQIAGQAPLNVAASTAANTRINTTATAGRAGSDGTTGAKTVSGVSLLATAGSAGVVEATLNYPAVGATI